jgi:hypothetical protein
MATNRKGVGMSYLSSMYGDLSLYRVGETVRAFDPRTLGVVKVGTIVKIGRKYATIDFGLSGVAKVAERDLLGHA